MIKIFRKLDSRSYWKNNELYNTERSKTYTVKVLGLTIWSNCEEFKDDPGEVGDSVNGIGYKKK